MNIIKAIINDFKTDIQFLKKVSSGEYKFPYTLREVLDIRPMLKDPKTWIFFMILILAVMTGMQISAKHYQRLANEEIIKANDFVNSHCPVNTSGYYSNTPNVDFTELMKGIEEGEAST